MTFCPRMSPCTASLSQRTGSARPKKLPSWYVQHHALMPVQSVKWPGPLGWCMRNYSRSIPDRSGNCLNCQPSLISYILPHVAARFVPFVVLLGHDCAYEPDDGTPAGEDTDDVSAPADLLVQPAFIRVVAPDLPPYLAKERGEREDVLAGLVQGARRPTGVCLDGVHDLGSRRTWRWRTCGRRDLIEFIESAPAAPLRQLIARARSQGTPVYTACSGTFLLAESGVLGLRRVTTTWWLTPAFRARYPGVDLDQTRMVVCSDGVTTAGAAFGHVDMALAVVRASSPALADLVSSYLVVDERPSQSAYTIPSALAQSDPAVAAFERWARDRLAEPISIPEAARAMGVSERTLQRATQRVLGTSPVRFVQDMRVEQAAHLLRTTDLSLEAISRQVGYEHANTLRVLLRERTGQTTRTLRGRTGAPA